MNEWGNRLEVLVKEACQHPPGSRERQKGLTKIIRLINSQLWKEQTDYYEDALQQTWIYFCQNLCEAKTGKVYDPTRATVITWLNAYLKRRLQDFYRDKQKEKYQKATVFIHDHQTIDILDNLPANPDIPPILSDLKNWVIKDSDRKLRNKYIKDHPEVNCQILILKRLPPEKSWQDLTKEFGISIGTLSSFYQRHCLPVLREFGKSEGYL